VSGWDVQTLVIQGPSGYDVYRPGSAGLPAQPPWLALRAPLDAQGQPQPVVGGFACGTPSAQPGPRAPDQTACLRVAADRRNFSYVVDGTTYEFAGIIAFPTRMVAATVLAKPGTAIPPGCELPFSLASYETQGPTWQQSGRQTFLAHDSATITAQRRSVTLTVTDPRCYGQTDLYQGQRVYDGGAGPGHGPVPDYASGTDQPRRLIGAWNGGTECVVPTPSTSTTPPATTGQTVSTPTPPAVVAGTKNTRPPVSNPSGSDDTGVEGVKIPRELAASGTGMPPVRVASVAILLLTVGVALCAAGRRLPADPVHELMYGGRRSPSHR
jgi:hypothetical protein